ncbi:ABC transporter substrate-binding protein [Nocardia aurea]|uniref:ABC transporter substrate-binding protein n=1 Tax=Nocardia aurea TaxID=2144174 RepID=UPI000D698784|nr:ABC transporter substrate-binding protein [Nocardia aurea]
MNRTGVRRVKTQRIVVALIAIALVAAGCGRDGGSEPTEGGGSSGPAAAANFGSLNGVCQPGSAKSAPTQGVTASDIEVGMFSDVGFTKNPDYVDAAKVFTSWCNAAGGINGRKVNVNLRDTNLMEVRQRMLEACREDFVLVGGSAALDGLGVKDRLNCLLPDFPVQVTQVPNTGSDLQVPSFGASASESVNPYTGYYEWLLKEAYPGSQNGIGLINGDSPITKAMGDKQVEFFNAFGAKIVYNDLYPVAGVSDWTPYAQSIKANNVKGLIFLGDFRYLAKLEDILTSMNYKLDWIDANANAYNQTFLDSAKSSLSSQNNFSDISGTAPLDAAATTPAIAELKTLYGKYAPGAAITFQGLRAFQTWLLFAKSAASCGDNLTRSCVYNAAIKETSWTAGGLQAPIDLSKPLSEQPRCFNVQQATPEGWKAADFKPNNGQFRCGFTPYKYTQDFGKPLTLADVGKSMNDLK